MGLYVHPLPKHQRPYQPQFQGLDGLSLSKAINWIKNNKSIVIGTAVVAGGAALAANAAGGWSALTTKEGWVKVGNAITGSSVVKAVQGVNVTSAINNTAKVLSMAATVQGGPPAPQGVLIQPPTPGLVYGAGNPVNGGGVTVPIEDLSAPGLPSEGIPTWALVAGLGTVTMLVLMARH